MTSSFRLPLFCVAALSLCAFAQSSRAQLVNGGFETGTFSPWVLNDPSMFSVIGTDSFFAHTGTNYAALSSEMAGATLSQTFATTAGISYTLSYWLAHDVTAAPSNQFSVAFNGVTIPASVLVNVGTQGYTNYTFTGLVAAGATSTIQFNYIDNDDFFRLDTVSVIPEPSTYALLLCAGGIFGLIQYRRRSAMQA